MIEQLKCCTLCPRECRVNRLSGERGFCMAGKNIKIARAALHYWEEPCISGLRGSGAVFFSHCTMQCVFCQNYEISTKQHGKEVSIQELSEIFLRLQEKGAQNINLVTPTHYVPQIVESVKLAQAKGLSLPIVYNSSGYERPETLHLLEGIVSVYLPDFKYFDNKYAKKYSNAPNYFEYARRALKEMFRQVGKPVFNEKGVMQKGIIVRHLMLPGLLFDSKKVVHYLYKTYKNDIYLSLMNQYTPLAHVAKYPEINRPLNSKHYDFIVEYALELGVENGFFQEEGTDKESFIPPFNEKNIEV